MKKKSKIDLLLDSKSWAGSFFRLTLVYGSIFMLYHSPTLAIWYSEYILNQTIIISHNRFGFSMIFFYVLGTVGTIFEGINIIRMVKEKRKQRQLLNED